MKIILSILFFPLIQIYRTILRKGSIGKRITIILFSLIVLLPIWILIGYVVIHLSLLFLGFPVYTFQINGDSMLPTYDNREYISTQNAHSVWEYKPHRGDVVVFQNAKTLHNGVEADFVKRVIGVGGDRIEFKYGDVYLNGHLLNEPYVETQDDTWLHGKLCAVDIVPQGKLFVMGDNRQYSDDSRDFGYIDLKDVVSYISSSSQKHDVLPSISQSNPQSIDLLQLTKLLNQERDKLGITSLTYDPLLSKSAMQRVNVMFKYNDLSYTATRSGYTVINAMRDVGFNQYGVTGESVLEDPSSQAQAIFDNIMGDTEEKQFFMNIRYTKLGAAVREGTLDGCQTKLLEFNLFGY